MTDKSILQSVLDKARAERDRFIEVPVESLGLVLTCRIPADGQEVERARNAARRVEKGAVAGTHFNRILVAQFTEKIAVGDVVLSDSDGLALTFRDPDLWRMISNDDLPVSDQKTAVWALLGTDGNIGTVAMRIVKEGGYGDEDAADDPF